MPPPPRLWFFKDINVIFHAVTVCSCQCMSNSLPCGSDLLAVMNSSQGKQAKLQYLLNFKSWQSINEDHHWLISIEWCLIVPLFLHPLPAVICKNFSGIQTLLFPVLLTGYNSPCMFLGTAFFGCTCTSNHQEKKNVEYREGILPGLVVYSVAPAGLTARGCALHSATAVGCSGSLAFCLECFISCFHAQSFWEMFG